MCTGTIRMSPLIVRALAGALNSAPFRLLPEILGEISRAINARRVSGASGPKSAKTDGSMSVGERGGRYLLTEKALIVYILPTMDQAILKKIERHLLGEKTKLETELGQFTAKNVHNQEDYNSVFPQYGDKEEDNATEVAEYSDNLTLERTLESALRDVKSALEAIKKGTYGTCKYCKKLIDPRRLLARPTSSSCIDCKKQLTK